MRSLIVVLAFLLSLPAHAQCSSAADVPVSTVQFEPTCGHSFAAIAANESGALGMWSNVHVGFSMVTYWLSGTVLDGEGSARRPAEHIYQYGTTTTQLATDGRDYLMAWSIGMDLWVRIIGEDGEARDGATKVATLAAKAPIRVAWNGTSYTVLSQDAASNAIVVLVTATGRVLKTGTVAPNAQPIAIARAPMGRVLVLLRTGGGVQSVQIDGDVPNALSPLLPIPTTAFEFSLASSGSGFLAVWREQIGDRDRIGGLVLEAPSPFVIANDVVHDAGIAAVWEGSNYLALYTNLGTEGVRIGMDGEIRSRFSAGSGSPAAAALNSAGTIVLQRAFCGSITSRLIARGAEPTPSRDVSLAAVRQTAPAIIDTGAGHQIFWTEPRIQIGRNDEALLTRVIAADGTPGEVRRLNDPGATVARFAVARVGNVTTLVWTNYPGNSLPGTLRAKRFDTNGNEIDSLVITSAWFIFDMAIAQSGSAVVVAWTQQKQTSSGFDAYAAVLGPDGSVKIPPTLLSTPADDMFETVAASEGSKTLVGWRNGQSTIVAVELEENLAVSNRRDIAAPTTGVVFLLAAALRDEQSLIVWWTIEGPGTLIRLHVTDASTAADVSLDRIGRIASVKIAPRRDSWSIFFGEYDDANQIGLLSRATLTVNELKDVEQLECVRDLDFDYTLRGERVSAVAFSAADPAIERSTRLYFRSVAPPRRRAVR